LGEPSRKIFSGQKRAKFGPISVDFEVRRPISSERMKIFKIGEFDIDSSRVRRNKSGEVWSSNLGDLDVELSPPKVHFLEDHILAPKGCCAPKFLHALENDQVLLAHPQRGRGLPLEVIWIS